MTDRSPSPDPAVERLIDSPEAVAKWIEDRLSVAMQDKEPHWALGYVVMSSGIAFEAARQLRELSQRLTHSEQARAEAEQQRDELRAELSRTCAEHTDQVLDMSCDKCVESSFAVVEAQRDEVVALLREAGQQLPPPYKRIRDWLEAFDSRLSPSAREAGGSNAR